MSSVTPTRTMPAKLAGSRKARIMRSRSISISRQCGSSSCAREGEAYAPVGAVEEGDAQCGLHLRDALGNRGLSGSKLARGCAEGAALGDGVEGFELPQGDHRDGSGGEGFMAFVCRKVIENYDY